MNMEDLILNRKQGRAWVEDIIAHLISLIFTLGFFAIVLIALSKWVDLKDPAVTAFIGTALGYTVGKLDFIFLRYYRPQRRRDDPQDVSYYESLIKAKEGIITPKE
jgi:hypothetical protein